MLGNQFPKVPRLKVERDVQCFYFRHELPYMYYNGLQMIGTAEFGS